MALQWNDLNFNTGELRIERQICQIKGELLIQPPKNKASIRMVILLPAVVTVLRVYKQTVSSRWMFPSPKKVDAPIAPSVVSHRLAKILKHAGCKNHDLRHVFATNALEHGMDVKTLSTIIGHISSATTLNIYAHVTDDMQRQAATKIDQGIGKAEAAESAPSAKGRESRRRGYSRSPRAVPAKMVSRHIKARPQSLRGCGWRTNCCGIFWSFPEGGADESKVSYDLSSPE